MTSPATRVQAPAVGRGPDRLLEDEPSGGRMNPRQVGVGSNTTPMKRPTRRPSSESTRT